MDNSVQKTISMLNITPLMPVIKKLLSESASIAVKSLCKEYTDALKNGKRDEQLCESFVIELSKIADTDNAKNILVDLNESVKRNETNIKLANQVYNLENSTCKFVSPVIESAVVDYLMNKNSVTRDDVRVAVSLFESDSHIKDIIETLNYESYVEKSGQELVNVELKKEFRSPIEKIYTEAEVNSIIESRINENSKNEHIVSKRFENRINLHSTIQTILKECGSNEKLKIFLGQYNKALNEGKAEELLYETFISGISNWNYLSAVDTNVSALKDRVSKYKQEIDFKKILETMRETASYYIVPLIEDLVIDYSNKKNMTNRAVLMQRLENFEYDPFIRDMISLINLDQSVTNNVYLGESVEFVNRYVHTELTYSPIMTNSVNESVFNIRESYYTKKGNIISKLNKKEVSLLPESFKALCSLVKSDNVKISNELNTISVYYNNNVGVISESEIIINGKKITDNELNTICETAAYTRNDELNFYIAVKTINENFDNIAYIDFVKSIVSNDVNGRSVDVFKINENIYVNTNNSKLGTSTFYRNVNPIQCRNYINEHMEINVAPLFEDVLPDQKDIEKGIEDKKNEYQSYIDDLEEKKQNLLDLKYEDMDSDDIDNAIELIDKEIEDAKSDYQRYQDDSDKFVNGDEDKADDELKNEPTSVGLDNNTDIDDKDDKDDKGDEDDKDDKGDEELSAETKDELSTPMNGDDKNNLNVTDDEQHSDFSDNTNDSDFDYSGVADFDSDFDSPVTTTDGEHSGFEVVRVSYNKNVKNNNNDGKGEVLVIIPCVDANGDIHDETRKVTFYLDTDRTPIINNEYMPLDLYNAIKKAIEDSPETSNIMVTGEFDKTPSLTQSENPNIAQQKLNTAEEPDELDKLDFTDEVSDNIVKDEPKVDSNIHSIEKETSTETSKDELPNYPIEIGLYPEEIEPKNMKDFEKDSDSKLKIEHGESESNLGEKVLKIKNKAQAYALMNYFKEWMNYSDEDFCDYFPELKICFDQKLEGIPVMATNEGVCIKGIHAHKDFLKENFRVVIPNNKELLESIGLKYENALEQVVIIPESLNEAKKIYTKVHEYTKTHKNEQDVIDLLESYNKTFKHIAEKHSYKLTLPYNGFLDSKLQGKGFVVESAGDSMKTVINPEDFNKVKKVLNEVYGEKAPIEARDFFRFINENVRITVKDENTGKTVEINTDDINGKNPDVTENDTDFDAAFNNTTFDPEKSLLFKDDDESADDENKTDEGTEDEGTEEEKSQKGKDEDSTDNKGSEKEHSKEGGEEKDGSEDKNSENKETKKKFKFKVTKKPSNESVVVKSSTKHLNESSSVLNGTPNVLDNVKLSDGSKGQIICKQADGNFIVNVMGHTKLVSPNEVSLVDVKFDTIDLPFKYDECTLKGCYENYVGCGLFVNDVQVTPNDCKIKILEYMNAKDDEEVNIVIEGQTTQALKKYLRINLDDVNESLDLANYRLGIYKGVDESECIDILINMNDYIYYKNVNESYVPVRVLSFDEYNNTHLSIVGGHMIKLNEANDEYVPVYQGMFEEAVSKLK